MLNSQLNRKNKDSFLDKLQENIKKDDSELNKSDLVSISKFLDLLYPKDHNRYNTVTVALKQLENLDSQDSDRDSNNPFFAQLYTETKKTYLKYLLSNDPAYNYTYKSILSKYYNYQIHCGKNGNPTTINIDKEAKTRFIRRYKNYVKRYMTQIRQKYWNYKRTKGVKSLIDKLQHFQDNPNITRFDHIDIEQLIRFLSISDIIKTTKEHIEFLEKLITLLTKEENGS